MDYSDLIKQFGSSKGEATPDVVTPHADLINEFGGGTVKATAPAQASLPEPRVPLSGATPEEEAAYYADIKNPKPTPFELNKLPIARQYVKGMQEATDMTSSGFQDLTTGRPASGVGKIVLGLISQASNASGIAPTIAEGTDQLAKITGNPEFADRASLVATIGLPVSKLTQAAAASMPSSRAVSEIVKAIGPENIPSVIEKLQSNPRLTLMDVNPSVQTITQGLAATPGQPRNLLDKVVRGRTDTKLDSVTGAIDEGLGTPVNVLNKMTDLKNQIKATGAEINPIVKNTKPVDISPVISSIDAKLNPGVNSVITAGEPLPLGDIEKSLEKVKGFITDGLQNRTDPQSLHTFQSSLRAKAEDLLSSTSGQDRQLGRALMDVRNQVVNAIDKSSPQITDAAGNVTGSYKPALAKYRDVNDIEDAFKKGQLITKNRLGNLEDDPSYWDKWIKEATPAELDAAKEGARLAYANQMGSVTNAARKGTEIPLIQFNKEKLGLLFGKPEVEKMSKALEDERAISDTNSKLFQGSQTAMRMLGADATKIRPDYEPKFTKYVLPVALEAGGQYLSGGSLPAVGLAAGVGYPFLRGQLTKIGQNLDRQTNVNIADLASSVGEARDNLIQALQAHVPQTKLTMAQKLKLSLPVAKP